jgi:hypothetical protein
MHLALSFTQNYPARCPLMVDTRRSNIKGAFAKARVLVGLLCVMEMWTMFRLASNAAHKNYCTDLSHSCSCHRQPSPTFCLSIYVWNHRNINWFKLWNQKIQSLPWGHRIEKNNCLPTKFIFSARWLSTAAIKWTSLMSLSGEQSICIWPWRMKEMHKINVLCVVSEEKVYGSFFLNGKCCRR